MHEVYIDYFQYSISYNQRACHERGDKILRPVPFYKIGYQDDIGIRRYFGNPKTKKALVIMSGEALHNQRVIGWGNVSTVSNVLAKGGKVSRMDIAITDHDKEKLITPEVVKESYRNGEIEGTLAKYGCKTIEGVDIGQPDRVETVYIGDMSRRGKSGIFRAYDKGLQLEGVAGQMARLELEERGNNAHMSAKRVADGHDLQSVIETRLKFKGEPFRRVFDGKPIDTSRGQALKIENDDDADDKRWNWLLYQVAPSLKKAIDADAKNMRGNGRMIAFMEKSGIMDYIDID